ncbi:MAG TPA: FtsX-like permease family protein, partial [Planctomycetota bacterium]|nr:FtsX-like permease family protein [Planctomycetota bacterium]
ANQFTYDVIVQQKGAVSPLLSHLTPKDMEGVLKLPGVKSADYLTIDLMKRKDETKPQPIVVLGLEPGGQLLGRYEVVRGKPLVADDTDEILVGELAAKQLGLDVGGELVTQENSWHVKGVFRAPVAGNDFLSGQAIANGEYLRTKFDQRPNFIVVHLRTEEEVKNERVHMKPEELDLAVAAIGSAMALEKRMKNRLEAKPFKSYLDSFNQTEVVDKFAWAMSFLAALVGGIGIANTMLMSVFERTREIGLLRAVGWSRTRICGLIVLEGLALSVAGGLLGVPLGLLEMAAAAGIVQMGWISPSLEPTVALEAVGLATLIGVIGSLYPGLRAANLEPTEALRYE